MSSNQGQLTPEAVLPPVRPVFRAFVMTVIPEAAALDAATWQTVERLVEEFLRDRPLELKRQFRLGMRAIQWTSVLRWGKRFTALDAERRKRFLAGIENHSRELVRAGFFGLRTLALLGYYGRPEAVREIGYTADPRGWEAPGVG